MKKQVIEYAGTPVGVLVPEKNALKFIAIKLDVHDLNKKLFRTSDELYIELKKLCSFTIRNLTIKKEFNFFKKFYYTLII